MNWKRVMLALMASFVVGVGTVAYSLRAQPAQPQPAVEAQGVGFLVVAVKHPSGEAALVSYEHLLVQLRSDGTLGWVAVAPMKAEQALKMPLKGKSWLQK